MKLIFSKEFMLDVLDGNYSRDNVRNKMNLPYNEFKKTPFSKNTSDMFAESSFLFTYDINDNLKEIEIYNNVEFDFLGERIFKTNFLELKNILKKLKISYEIIETSIITDEKSINFYFPDLDEDGDNAKLESILMTTSNF